MDIRKIQTELGWSPKESLETGMLRTVRWYLENGDWVDAIHNQADFQGWLEQNYQKREVGK
jgi:dTDP-glucose 4,6-dehydratase